MKRYTTAAEAVADMHERGFTSDFQLSGNDLLWVQQQNLIRMGLFAIVEYHRFWNPASKDMNVALLGVVTTHYNVRGILFIDYARYPCGCPPVIIRKMNELNQNSLYRGNMEI